MKLRITLCDDDISITEKLHNILISYAIKYDIEIDVNTFHSGNELIKQFTGTDNPDIIFLDIEMPGINGIEAADYIRNQVNKRAYIIFISNYPKYMLQSFSVHPYHFLQKPVENEKVFEVINSIVKDINDSVIYKTILTTTHAKETINILDISYIESADAKNQIIKFHFHDFDKIIETTGQISKWEALLAPHNFALTHRGILVNLLYIHYIEKGHIVLDTGEILRLSRTNEKKIRSLYAKQIIPFNKL